MRTWLSSVKPNIKEIFFNGKKLCSLAEFLFVYFRKYNCFHKNMLVMLHVMSLLLFLKEVIKAFKFSFPFLKQ